MAISSDGQVAIDGDESESYAPCAFMWVQDVHHSEAAAIQQETNELLDEECYVRCTCAFTGVQDVHFLKGGTMQQKTNEMLRKVEEIENRLHNVLKRLEDHSIPTPEDERKSVPSLLSDDSTSSDKGSIGKLSSTFSEESLRLVDEEKNNADHKKHRHCSLGDHNFPRASVMLPSLSSSSSEEIENENEEGVELADETLQSKSNSQEQQHDFNTTLAIHLQAPVQEISIQRKIKLSDVERHVYLHVLEIPSKIKYKDTCKQDGTLAHPLLAAAQTGLAASHQDTESTSLSLVCSPRKGTRQVQNNSSQLNVDCDTLLEGLHDYTLENCYMTKVVDRFKLQSERQAREIEILRRAQYQQEREIMKLMALCEQKNKDLNEMEEWIASFMPVMDENELKMTQQETTIMELSETVNELMILATNLLVVVLSSHRLDFTYNYHLKLQ